MQDEGFALYRRFLDGDVGGLEELIALYKRGLFRFIHAYVQDDGLAEDVLQEVFVALYYKRSFKQKEGASFKTYLYKIARNKSLNAIKKRKRKKEVSLEGMLENNAEKPNERFSEQPQALYEEDPEAKLERTEKNEMLKTALGNLSEQYREVLVLRYLEDMPPERIATVTKRKIKQVYNLLARGKTALKEELKKIGFEVNEDEIK